MSRRIIISDLHVDTWKETKINGKPKKDHFLDFIDCFESAGIDELIINGDLMDFPPYKSLTTFSDRKSVQVTVADRLISFARIVPVTYVFGNHDIGISGIRALSENSVSILRNLTINLCYPSYVLNYKKAKRIILIEHGHFCDPVIRHAPVINSYADNIVERVYGEWLEDKKVHWAMKVEAGKPKKAVSAPTVGKETAVKVKKDQALYDAVVARNKREKQYSDEELEEMLRKWREEGSIKRGIRQLFRRGAYKQMEKFINLTKPKNNVDKITQVFGHTHCADMGRREINGINCEYWNPGSWEGKSVNCEYLDIDDQGNVWLHDWVADSAELRRL